MSDRQSQRTYPFDWRVDQYRLSIDHDDTLAKQESASVHDPQNNPVAVLRIDRYA
jgi:hypothetical protein